MCIVLCIKESNKREPIIESQACCDQKWETSIHAMTIYGFYSWLDIFEEYVRYKIVRSIISRLHGVKQKRRHTLMCYILVLYFEACNAWNIIIKSWLQSMTSTLWSKDRNKCSCVMWWFLNMACPNKVCFVSKDQKFFITMQDKEMNIQEWIMEFIVDVQRLSSIWQG